MSDAHAASTANWNWAAIGAQGAAERGADWEAEFGEFDWECCLVAFGEFAPADLATMSDEERRHYALAPRK